jgi:uncharacterized membrane protein YfcA
VLAAAVLMIASAVQGSVGFGAALLAAPVLLLIHPAFAPGPILVSNLVLTLLVVRREWSFVDFGSLRFLASGRLIGTILAGAVLANVSQVIFDLLFAALVLIAVALSLPRGGFERSARNLTVAGVASGLMGTLSSIGGPPVALVYQGVDPPRFRATLGVLLILGASMSIAATWVVGRFGDTEAALSGVPLGRPGPGRLRGLLALPVRHPLDERPARACRRPGAVERRSPERARAHAGSQPVAG